MNKKLLLIPVLALGSMFLSSYQYDEPEPELPSTVITDIGYLDEAMTTPVYRYVYE